MGLGRSSLSFFCFGFLFEKSSLVVGPQADVVSFTSVITACRARWQTALRLLERTGWASQGVRTFQGSFEAYPPWHNVVLSSCRPILQYLSDRTAILPSRPGYHLSCIPPLPVFVLVWFVWFAWLILAPLAPLQLPDFCSLKLARGLSALGSSDSNLRRALGVSGIPTKIDHLTKRGCPQLYLWTLNFRMAMFDTSCR